MHFNLAVDTCLFFVAVEFLRTQPQNREIFMQRNFLTITDIVNNKKTITFRDPLLFLNTIIFLSSINKKENFLLVVLSGW